MCIRDSHSHRHNHHKHHHHSRNSHHHHHSKRKKSASHNKQTEEKLKIAPDIQVKGRGFVTNEENSLMRGWKNNSYESQNDRLKFIDSKIKQERESWKKRNVHVYQEQQLEKQNQKMQQIRKELVEDEKNQQDQAKKKDDGNQWAHDKFEIMLRSPSPTNENFQTRKSPSYERKHRRRRRRQS
eukprot:TRINITY_DN2456_c0_g1_i1.p1 TRINITY_DN2456_c0_g1~~TRINITY_DN2456_c0_g1_i1.p1  ORF type:complete len:183 (-),score=31.46 TRINITY_DN2456_c0_g1_i1:31-579(-)